MFVNMLLFWFVGIMLFYVCVVLHIYIFRIVMMIFGIFGIVVRNIMM